MNEFYQAPFLPDQPGSQLANIQNQAVSLGERFKESKFARFSEGAAKLAGIAAAALLGYGIAAPYAMVESINDAKITADGILPQTATFAPGYSSIDLGFGFRPYNTNLTKYGVGIDTKLEGLALPENIHNQSALQQSLQPVVRAYQNPEGKVKDYGSLLLADARHRALATDLQLGTLLELMSLGVLIGASKLPTTRRNKILCAAGGLAAIASVPLYGAHDAYEHWHQDHPMPTTRYEIPSLQRGELKGTFVTTTTARDALQNAAPLIESVLNREKSANDAFVQAACANIDQNLAEGKFVPPKEGEKMTLLLSDLHSNQDMISIYKYLVKRINETYGENTVALVILTGDQSYGSIAEVSQVKDEANISDGAPLLEEEGNHDGELTENIEKDAGMTHMEGKTLEPVPGLTVLGDTDPTLTELPGLLGITQNVSRNGDGMTEAEMGAKLLVEAEATHPTFLAIHEAYALQEIIKKNDISSTTMAQWFNEGRKIFPPPVPAKVVAYGHFHDQFMFTTTPYSGDQRGSTIFIQLDSAGGVPNDAISFSNLSTPWTTPKATASAVFVTTNEDGFGTLLQEFTTTPESLTSFSQHYITQPAQMQTAPEHKVSNSKNGEAVEQVKPRP